MHQYVDCVYVKCPWVSG